VNTYLASIGGNSSILLYIPDLNSDLEDIFKQCEKLQCNVDTTVIPVMYSTSQDVAHFSISKDINLLADQCYIAPKKELLQGTVKKVIDGIVYPKNFFPKVLELVFSPDLMKLALRARNLKSAPILEKKIFSPKNKTDSVSGPAASVKNVFNRLETLLFYSDSQIFS
jgi:hypothetical protein